MTLDERDDDAVLSRVARARPPIDEAEVAPTGERAVAILNRVLDLPRVDVPPARR